MRVAECGPAQRGAKWQLRNKNIIYNTIFFAFVVLKWRHRFWMRLERQRQLFILIFGCNNFVCKILQNTESIFLLRKFQLLLKRQISGRRLSKTSEWKKKMMCVCVVRVRTSVCSAFPFSIPCDSCYLFIFDLLRFAIFILFISQCCLLWKEWWC